MLIFYCLKCNFFKLIVQMFPFHFTGYLAKHAQSGRMIIQSNLFLLQYRYKHYNEIFKRSHMCPVCVFFARQQFLIFWHFGVERKFREVAKAFKPGSHNADVSFMVVYDYIIRYLYSFQNFSVCPFTVRNISHWRVNVPKRTQAEAVTLSSFSRYFF